MGTDTGFGAIRDGQYEPAPFEAGDVAVHALAAGADGDVWAGTLSGRLIHYSDSRVNARIEVGVPINFIAEVEPGTLWVGTNRGALVVSDGRVRPLSADPRIAAVPVWNLARTSSDSSIWVYSSARVFRIDVSGDVSLASGQAQAVNDRDQLQRDAERA